MQKIKDRNIRKLTKVAGHSLSVTLPKEMVGQLKWKEKQKITVSKKGSKLIIKDWKKRK